MLLSIFDPADKLLGLKLTFFVLSMFYGFFWGLIRTGSVKIPLELLAYVFIMIFIPFMSICLYFIAGGGEPFEGFQMIKAYVFISFSLILYLTRTNIFKGLSFILSMLSVVIICIFTILLYEPSLIFSIYNFGRYFGVFYLDDRNYGSGLRLTQIYFASSPMLVISIAYYYHKARFSEKKKIFYDAIVFLNVIAMFIAGTRNNMIVSLLLPLTLYFIYTKNRALSAAIISVVVVLVVAFFHSEIEVLFDPSEVSNSIKLALIQDYLAIFSDPLDLMFGQGLGAYYYWTAKGAYYYVTELTFFEIIRNFGVILGGGMILLLMYPIIYTYVINKKYTEKHIIIAYMFYLIMCFSNPNLFSSMGMLILAGIIANIFLYKKYIRERAFN